MNRKRGLRVQYHDHVERLSRGAGEVLASVRAGWFVETFYSNRWHALMDLRFVREKDALRAVQSLTAAGLDSHGAIAKADPMTVIQLATEFLQW